ncbi:sugar-transfer associated ATP-grasp domain-containing protein [Acinetobacter indicus]|uniref:sugar-transfer associated ATP-grasp domain-containing protein n=1 Tax=Acinetobacter indicus TaxID=756892 RepID=UPI0014443074|nr:sugar-transfer associated ATP-grasp domain-containing protein [Acinetobacter indicus]
MKKHVLQIYTDIKISIWNHNFNKDALFYLNSIESREGKLNKNLIKLCDEYALDCFKNKVYAPWLYVYTAMHKEFKEGWIPDNYFGIEILPKINGSYGKIASLRPLNKRIFQNTNLFPDLLYFINGRFLNASTLEQVDFQTAKNILFKNFESIVFKKNESAKGKGIIFLTESEFSINTIMNLNADGVFQNKIEQHDFFKSFNNAVSTLRVNSFIDLNGHCEIIFCDLRLPTGNVTHVYDGSYIRIPVNPKTGQLFKKGYFSEWSTTEHHPDNSKPYHNLEIPMYFKIVEHIKKLHLSYPLPRIIGWDIIIDNENNIQILEWNANHPGIKFAEATVGPVFKNYDLINSI